MRLLKCHIEGFGCLVSKDIEFDEKITQIFKNNGEGKTTFFKFIKSIFYGFKTKKEKEQYKPASNCRYFGNLEFIKDNIKYRIEREFIINSTKDDLKIFCNDVLNEDLANDQDSLGYKIIGLDLDGFSNTFSIDDKDIEVKDNTSINEKLNDYVTFNKTNQSFEDICKKLEDKIKTIYEPKSSKKSKYIDCAIKKEEIDKNIEIIKGNLKDKDIKISQKNNLEIMQEEINKKRNNKNIINNWKYYDELLKTYDDKNAEYVNELKEFNGIIPNQNSINTINDLKNQYDFLNSRLEQASIIDESRFLELSKEFKNGVPTAAEIIEFENIENNLEKCNFALDELQNNNKNVFKFDSKNYDKLEEDINEVKNLNKEYKDIQNQLIATSESISLNKNNNKSKLPLIGIILGSFIGIVGIVLLFINLIVGAITTIVGIAVLTSFLVIHLKSSKPIIYIGNDQTQIILKSKHLEEEIIEILSKYDSYNKDYTIGINELEKKAYQHKEYLENELKKDQLNNKINELENSARIILKKYENIDFNRNLSYRINQYNELLNEKEIIIKTKENLNEKIKSIITNIQVLCDENNLNCNEILYNKNYINNIIKKISMLEEKKYYINEILHKAENYKKSYNLTIRPEFENVDFDKLENDYQKILVNLDAINKELRELEESEIKLENLEIESTELRDEMEKCKEDSNLIKNVLFELKSANNALREKYVGPIKNMFNSNMEKFKSLFNKKIYIGDDLTIKVEINGSQKECYYLSSGEKQIAMMCFRLSLINKMYEKNNDKPFIIMDDPFVYLDEEKLATMKCLINNVVKENQIIYFTCHSSRKLII